MASPDLALLLPLVSAAVAETTGLDPWRAVAIQNDLSVIVTAHASGRDIGPAVEDLATTLAAVAAAHSGNATLVNAAKVVADFPTAKKNLESGQAVVLASPYIDGRDCLLVLVAKGGAASGALGV